jgi:tetratricopeptide (TPR) repeat protein
LAYNFNILSRSGAIFLSVFALATVLVPSSAKAQPDQPRTSQILLIMPFENTSSQPGLDWMGEAFPEVMGSRLTSGPLFMVNRDDRLLAFDQLGIPSSAKPSRATVYEIAQRLEADYVLMGTFRVENGNLTARARVMDTARLRLGPELSEGGSLANLIAIQSALTWDLLDSLKLTGKTGKQEFVARMPPVRLDALENYVRGVIAGNNAEKIKRFLEAVRLDPNDTLAMLQLGKTYYVSKDYTSAISFLSRVPQSDPNINEAQFYLGLSAFYGGQPDKAEAAFASLSQRLPLTEIFNNLGVVSARRGDRRAREYFERSVETEPSDPDYHFNLAVELYREGDSSGAARELRAALVIQQDSEARTFLDAINAGGPKSRLPLERIKRNYDESGFRQLALELENAEEARLSGQDAAHHSAFHIQRGHELLEQGLNAEAEKQFREAVSLTPFDALAHAGLAEVLVATQRFPAAREEARSSLRLKPVPEAYLVMARLALVENQPDEATQNLDQALALDPANAAALALKKDIAARTANRARNP